MIRAISEKRKTEKKRDTHAFIVEEPGAGPLSLGQKIKWFFSILSLNKDFYFPATDRQTDGRTDGQKAMHMSPPCSMHRWAQKLKLHTFPEIAHRVNDIYNPLGKTSGG